MFGKKLRELRQEAGLLIKHLAKEANLSIVYVSDMERERRDPPKKEHIRLFCKALESRLGYFPEDLFSAADIDRGRIEISLEQVSPQRQEVYLRLARIIDQISDEDLECFVNQLEQKAKEGRSYISVLG